MALIEKRETGNSGVLGIWQITESEDELLARVEQRIPVDRELWQRRAANARKQWLCVRLLLWELLGRCEPIVYDEFGKPQVADRSCEIAVSHSHDMVAVVVQPQTPTGVDIEVISAKVDRIRNKFLNPSELADIPAESNRLEKLLVYWGAKEALYKLFGKRQVDFRVHLHIAPFSFQNRGEIEGEIIGKEGVGAYRLAYEKLGRYILVYVLNR